MSKLIIGRATCSFCGYRTTTGGIQRHVENCSKNPNRIKPKKTKLPKPLSPEEFSKVTKIKFKNDSRIY